MRHAKEYQEDGNCIQNDQTNPRSSFQALSPAVPDPEIKASHLIYFGGFGFGTKLRENKNVQLLGKWLGKRSFYTAIFIAAVIPVLPLDDYIYIGAGANRGRLLPMLGVTVPAKIVKSAIEIWVEISGLIAINGLIHGLGLNSLTLSIVLSAGFVVLGFILYKIDWQEILKGRISRAQ